METRAKQVALAEADRIKALTTAAVQSRAYLYPFKGILYFLSYKALWIPLLPKLIPMLSLSIVITALMFIVAYLPQAAIMAFTSGPVAAFTAILLTLSEASTLINIISWTFLIENALIDTFDGTLVMQGCVDLVADRRQVKPGTHGADPIARLGELVKKPFAKFTPRALVRYMVLLPLNFVPVVGTVMFIILQGKRNGPSAHSRYFELKGWSERQREEFVEQNRGAYTSFGVASFLLEMVPFASLLFSFTNTVGAALWAADLEKSQTATTSPNLRKQAVKAE